MAAAARSRGFKREQNAVTIMAALGVHQFSNGLSEYTGRHPHDRVRTNARVRGHRAQTVLRDGIRGRAHGGHRQSRLDAR